MRAFEGAASPDEVGRERRVRALFLEALGLAPTERARFVARVGERDAEEATRLAALLDEDGAPTTGRLAGPATALQPGLGGRAPATLLAPGARVGRYRIVEVLGEGGMGTVYLAEQEQPFPRRVALKVLKSADDGAALARFSAERWALARMEHPAIAALLDAGSTANGLHHLALEHVAGAPLAAYCSGVRASLAERLALLAELADAVEHAHRRGVLHGDLKPANVLVAREGDRTRLALLDFGIASALGAPRGAGLGTPQYMAPECDREACASAASDVYALGVVAHELLCGVLPHEHGAAAEERDAPRRLGEVLAASPALAARAAHAMRLSPAALERAVRGELERLVAAALAPDPARRPASAAVLRDGWRRLAASRAVRARPAPASRGFAVALALAVAAAASWWSAMPPNAPRADAATLEVALTSLTRALSLERVALAHRACGPHEHAHACLVAQLAHADARSRAGERAGHDARDVARSLAHALAPDDARAAFAVAAGVLAREGEGGALLAWVAERGALEIAPDDLLAGLGRRAPRLAAQHFALAREPLASAADRLARVRDAAREAFATGEPEALLHAELLAVRAADWLSEAAASGDERARALAELAARDALAVARALLAPDHPRLAAFARAAAARGPSGHPAPAATPAPRLP